ncbi:MAG: polysaccharide ABC transporter ATP-binding protein [Saprospiraceae bacterium]
MKPVIEVDNIWKEYRKGIDRKYKSLRETVTNLPREIFGGEKETFWALKDINFTVNQGESIGIIGRNGAGKSTLLKILSRITPPTKGSITLRGRVASLLEVGTGFHPELTGRENIFFNGSILGMRHHEIKQKFDEIVDFSGVESFIDTPLKHYSSGMQMRLAFSVAAHLDSEILLIDEVLAVGDAEFQKKCIGKMDEVSKGEGKTILFVSHDLNQIKNLCQYGLLIQNGTLFQRDLIDKVIDKYVNTLEKTGPIKFNKKDNKSVYINYFSLKNDVITGSFCEFELHIESKINIKSDFAIGIRNLENQPILQIFTEHFNSALWINIGLNKFSIIIENLNLTPGTYSINLWLGNGLVDLDFNQNCIQLIINQIDKNEKNKPFINFRGYYNYNSAKILKNKV